MNKVLIPYSKLCKSGSINNTVKNDSDIED